MRWICVLLFSVLMFLGSSAARAHGPLVDVLGAGSDSCGKYVTAYRDYRANGSGNEATFLAWRSAALFYQYQSWIQGYITAAAAFHRGHIQAIDGDALVVWVNEYCQKHPLQNIVDAANRLYIELGGTFPTWWK